MTNNIFSPKVQDSSVDSLSNFFHKTALTILVVVFGLLPIVFIPGVYVALGFTKTFFVVLGLYGALIFACLAVLRSGKVRLYLPLSLIMFWLFALFSVASALLSGDVADSLYGSNFEVNTAGFFVLMAVIATMTMLFSGSKRAFSRLLMVAAASVGLVYLLYLVRLIFGPEFLSFGIFNSNLISTLGSLNDLALYTGLVLMIILVTATKLPSSRIVKISLAVLVVISLFLLAIANFYSVWVVVGFVSLLTFLYLVARDTWLMPANVESSGKSVPRFPLAIVGLICLVSGAFVVSGDYLGGKVSESVGLSYLEVRPSLDATFDITRQVYKENILFGVGPNRFEDAWRMHKDSTINQTQFWSTNFSGGNGFVTTLFATTGLVGVVLFLVFIITFLYLGYRMFFQGNTNESGWSDIGLISFTSACYLWLMTFLYTPGSVIMITAAVATGLTLAVWVNSKPEAGLVINVAYSRRHGFLLVASTLVVIVTATVLFIGVNKQYISQYLYTKAALAVNSTGDLATYDQNLTKVAQYDSRQDTYNVERARLRLSELTRLQSIAEPTEDDKALFEKSLVEGISLAEAAVASDATNPYNHALLGSFFGLIDKSSFEGIEERRQSAFARAEALDPTNPEYAVVQAQQLVAFGELGKVREYLNKAVNLKSNYTEALSLLAQLDIQEGNATSAIATTKAIISIEPSNPGRYFQLGLLLISNQNLTEAAQAFEIAVALDTNYANARYMLALVYLDTGRADEALTQLKIVAESNSENKELMDLIARIESGDVTSPGLNSPETVSDAETVDQDGESTVVTDAPDTDLVTPVNTVPIKDEGEETSATEQNSTDSANTAAEPGV